MAKKRKTRKKKGRRVGRASALNLTPAKKERLVQAFGVAVGVVAARFFETYATKQLTSITTNMQAGIEVAMGGLTTVMAPDPLLQGIGMGVASAGLANLAKGAGLISGIGAPIVFPTRRVGTTNGSGIPMIGSPGINYSVPRVGNSARNMYASVNGASVGRGRVGDVDYGGIYG